MAVAPQVVSFGFQFREFQAMLFSKMKRFNVVVCHRRFGKTVFAILYILIKAFQNELKYPIYAYIAPTYGQAERVAWSYFEQMLVNIPGVDYNKAKLRIKIARPWMGDHITLYLLGAENPDSIRGLYLDGAVLDEYAQCSPEIWGQAVRPMLTDRKGWALFIGTPKGMNNFYDIYQMAIRMKFDNPALGWTTFLAKASVTKVIDDEELKGARMEMSEEEYAQEFECSFSAALVGSYYGKYINDLEDKKQITRVPYEPAVLVDTYWDLGIGDSTCIWFIQQVNGVFHIIDYLEMSGVGLEYYAAKLKEKVYAYGEHWLPHDGAAKDLSTGNTRQETLATLGVRVKIAPKLGVDDGINAVRMVLPKCYFDSVATQRGVNCLKNYERRWNSKNNIFEDKPLHNWASHGSDAFRVFATVQRRGTGVKMKDIPRTVEYNYNPLGR